MRQLLIFDAYGTLISTGNGSVSAARSILALQEKDIDTERFYADWKKYHRRHIDRCGTEGFLPERRLFEMDLEALYMDYGIDRPFSEDVSIMLASLEHRALFPETAEVIRRLREKYRVVIGSTTDTRPLLLNLSQSRLEVDEVYTSEMLKSYKPSAQFYRAILRREGRSAKETMFIGDSLIDDVAGPKNIGMQTVLIDRAGKHKSFSEKERPHHIVSDLTEVITILDNQG